MDICLILLSEILLYELLDLSMAEGPVFVVLLLWHDLCERTEEWKLDFPRKGLGRNLSIKRGKMNRAL